MDDWLTSISQFFVDLLKSVFTSLVDFIHDAFFWVFDGVLSAIAALVASIPTPSFLSQSNGIGGLLSGLPPFCLYVISHIGLPPAFAIIASGVAFRLLRKLFTLGQW
jgi:hypothetical protein